MKLVDDHAPQHAENDSRSLFSFFGLLDELRLLVACPKTRSRSIDVMRASKTVVFVGEHKRVAGCVRKEETILVLACTSLYF